MVSGFPRMLPNGATLVAALAWILGELATTRKPSILYLRGLFTQSTSKLNKSRNEKDALQNRRFRVVAELDQNPRGASEKNILKLDFDRRRAPSVTRFLHHFRTWEPVPVGLSYSRSTRGNWHCTIVLRRQIPEWKRIAYQLVLGSDPERECRNFERLLRQDVANLLFKRKII